MKRKGGFSYTLGQHPAISGGKQKPSNFQFSQKSRKISPGGPSFQTVARTRGVYGQGEMKYFDTFKAPTAIPASSNWTTTEMDPATLDTIFDPTQGNAISQRIGQKAQLHKLKIKGTVDVPARVNQSVAESACVVRLILFQDMQTNATQAQGEELMRSEGTSILNIDSFQNFNEFGRFRVYKDKVMTFNGANMSFDGTNIETAGLSKQFKFNLNFTRDPIPVRFNATNGGTVADIVDNSWHILAISSQTTSMAPTIAYSARCTFKG